MLNSRFLLLRSICSHHNCLQGVTNYQWQWKLLSSNLISDKVNSIEPKKPKKQPIPKITLLGSDENITITTLTEAQHISKRRDLKLVKIIDIDTKTQRPVYKLMSGAEYHTEELKQRELRKKEKKTSGSLKGEKLLMLNANISTHDLETNIKKVVKWISKQYEVRVVISGDSSNVEKSVSF